MALVKCKECGQEVSQKATSCPKCGAPIKKKTSLFTWIVAIVLGVWFIGFLSKQGTSPTKHLDKPLVVDPDYQMHFEQARTSKVKAYSKAINEIQQSAIFNQANAETSALISKNGAHFVGWTGILSTISTSHGGKDVFIAIDSSWGASYKINEDVPLSSPIYHQASTLKEGQHVKFSGTLIPADDSLNHWERSLTEIGSLDNPEFRVAFDNIEPIQTPGKQGNLSAAFDNTAKAVADRKTGKQNSSTTGLYAGASGANLDDGAFQHCSVLIGYFSGLPMWRDGGVVPLARAKDTLDKIITEDPPEDIPITRSELAKWLGRASTPKDMADWNAMLESKKSGLGAWRSAVASTPPDVADWNVVIESIYNSKVTEKQIDRALRKYCTNYTKHVFRASDLNSLLSKSQKSQQNKSSSTTAPSTDTDYTCVNGLQRKGVSYTEAMARCTFQQ